MPKLFAAFICASFFVSESQAVVEVGSQEQVVLRLVDSDPLLFPARIDTGATTSSLHATKIEEQGPNVAFQVQDLAGHVHFYRLKTARKVQVKSANGKPDTRFVVQASLCMGEETLETEFSLKDRSHMKFPVLIGRQALKGHFLVDVARENILGAPHCKQSDSRLPQRVNAQ